MYSTYISHIIHIDSSLLTLGNSSASSHEAPAQLVKSGTYNDLNQELHLVTAPGVYDDGPVSCASSAGGEQDAWSRALDCLDAITTPDMVIILVLHNYNCKIFTL